MGKVNADDVNPPTPKMVGEPADFVTELEDAGVIAEDEVFLSKPLAEQRRIFRDWLKSHMEDKVHYGKGHAASKVDVLLQAGAEHILAITGGGCATELESNSCAGEFWRNGQFILRSTVTIPEDPPPGVPLPAIIRGTKVTLWGAGSAEIDNDINKGIQKGAKRSMVAAVKRAYLVSDLYQLEAEDAKGAVHSRQPYAGGSSNRPGPRPKVKTDAGITYAVIPEGYEPVEGDKLSRDILNECYMIAQQNQVPFNMRYASFLIHLKGRFPKTNKETGAEVWEGNRQIFMEPIDHCRGDLRKLSPGWRQNILRDLKLMREAGEDPGTGEVAPEQAPADDAGYVDEPADDDVPF